MDKWDKAIRFSSVAAVAFLAAVAGWVSYTHALDVVRSHGQSGAVAYAYPTTVDGLIYVSSMVLLAAARSKQKAHRLAWLTLCLGILVTGAANFWSGLSHGYVGAAIYAWPALALVLSYELLMLLIRGTVTVTIITPENVTLPATAFGGIRAVPGNGGKPEAAARPEALPSIRSIMRDQGVGYGKARKHHEQLKVAASG